MALTSTDITVAAVGQRLTGRRTDLSGRLFLGLIVAALGLTVVTLVTLLVSVTQDAMPVLQGGEILEREHSPDIDRENLTITVFGETIPLETREDPVTGGTRYYRVSDRSLGSFLSNGVNFTRPADNGISQGIFGTFGIAVMVILLALPLGIGAAIYLEEYAGDSRLSRLIDVNIRNLAGVPSIVYGILGFTILVKALEPLTGGRSLLSAGITMSVLVLPIVIITAAEAIRAVPDSLREAGFGVGATRWEVVRHHVLPYAMPGILTGAMLSLARALGEAAPLILVGAQTGFFTDPDGALDRLTGSFTALPMQVFNFTRQPGEVLRVQAAAGTIVILLLIVLAVNATGIVLRNRFEAKRS